MTKALVPVQGIQEKGEPRSSASARNDNTALTGSLGVASIVFMVVAAAAPLTVIGGGAPLGIRLGNGAGYPSMYIISAAVLILFTVGLNAMSRTVRRPGAFSSYVGQGLGAHFGLAAAILALLVYTGIQIGVYCFFGVSLSHALDALGLTVPWWSLTAGAIAGVAWLGFHHVDLSSKVLGVLLVLEIGVAIVLSMAIVLRGGADGLSATPFMPAEIAAGAPGVGLMFAIAGFIGFESTAVFRDEAKDPERTVPRATYLSVILIGVFYAFCGWALVMGWGPDGILDAVANDPENLIMATALRYLGAFGGVAIQLLLLTSLFACVLSFHNVLARYLFTLGSMRALPDALGDVHPLHMSPHKASLAQTGSAVILLTLIVMTGMDPVLQAFTWFSAIATLGIVILMACTSAATVAYFRADAHGLGSVRTRWAPIGSMISLIIVAAVIVVYFPTLAGGGWGSALALVATIPGSMLVGCALATWHRRSARGSWPRIVEHFHA